MPKANSAADIRSLANRLREIAESTAMQEYARLMTRAALELEHRAAQVESTDPRAVSAILKAVA